MCNIERQNGVDECDYMYQAYKCYWVKVRNYNTDTQSVRIVQQNIFGIDRHYDEEEIFDAVEANGDKRKIENEQEFHVKTIENGTGDTS
jgi:uncharacterized membrane protein